MMELATEENKFTLNQYINPVVFIGAGKLGCLPGAKVGLVIIIYPLTFHEPHALIVPVHTRGYE